MSGTVRKRKAPEKPRASSFDLMDSIMGGMTRTMDKVPVRSAASRAALASEEALESVSHYQMLRSAPEAFDKTICRNPDCGGREFDVDMRQGDRICRLCGAVQNTRSVESYEEEKRTFADDDKKEDKSRTSAPNARGGTSVGNANLAKVQRLAEDASDGKDGISEKDQRRIDEYKTMVRSIADAMCGVQGQIVLDAQQLSEKFVAQQLSHDRECGKPGGTCRLCLSSSRTKPALIAAALLKEALRKAGHDRLFEELKGALKAVDVAATDAKKVGRTATLVQDLLKGRPFPCEEAEGEESAHVLGSVGAASSSASTGAAGGSAAGGNAEHGAEGGAQPLHQAAGAVPRLCEDLSLPFPIQQRAVDIVEDWQRYGMPALQPVTVASLAILRSYDEIRNEQLPATLKVDVATVAYHSGLTVHTINGHINRSDLPWPTSIVRDAMKSVQLPPSLSAQAVAEAAYAKLKAWLRHVVGVERQWCRDTHPRLLGACALIAGSQVAAAEAGHGGAAPPPPLTVAAAADAVGSDPQSVQAAMAKMPPGL
jgi:transcription initiation factor TFIIIB Brf1 subunit/transcription initiation factor TFIIB